MNRQLDSASPPWLAPLLEQGIAFDPNYLPSGNSDHLPMMLCAIAGLGLDEAVALEVRERYLPRLHQVPAAAPLAHWREALGERARYPDLLKYFQRRIDRDGIADTVAEVLPDCIASMAQAAFHPLIRLAYAIDFDHSAEAAAGLACMVSAHVDTPMATPAEGGELRTEFGRLAAAEPFAFSSDAFGRSVRELVDAHSYPTGHSTLADCAEVSLDVFRSTRNFFALHMVTATQAARVCARVVEPTLVERALTGALCAAYLVVGTPGFDARAPLPMTSDWHEDHTYKFAWSALAEYREYGDARYLEEVRSFCQLGLLPSAVLPA